jgi:pyridoxamine 5'-phosphate oxidase family protein
LNDHGNLFLEYSAFKATMFNKDELKYLKSQFLARIATATPSGRPNVATVGFEFDGKHFYVGSISQEILHSTPKYKNVKKGNKQVAMTIDDLVSVEPWKPRGIRVNGVAEIVVRKGEFGKGEYIRIKPKLTWSWGLGKSRTKTVWKT